ncbi:MAG: acetate kinase [Bacteroidales bacterium]|jgi:acetate kinase|nr:acetate kinase [Bacteroidales bacterium]
MKVLVLNCGSSSIKYQLFDMPNEEVLAKGLVEKIKLPGSIITHKRNDDVKTQIVKDLKDHKDGIAIVLDLLTSEDFGSMKDIHEIKAVGHRVVHAGEAFGGSVRISDKVIEALKDCIELAPLHNPANLEGIYAATAILPHVPQVGVFDTAFHQTMPEYVFQYGIPYEIYEKYKVRRYGFHGSSHKFVSRRAAEMLNKPIENLKIITCHLGNGASIAAVKYGKSFDTSMGMTPVEGLIMGTRVGDFDLGAACFIAEKEHLTIDGLNNFVNKKCGVQGVSGVSSDMRDVESAAEESNKRAQLALDMYYYRVIKYIGAYAGAMGGVDAIVFTGGIGENDPVLREKVCEYFGFIGLKFNKEINKGLRGKDTILTESDSEVAALLICTNEELVISRDTYTIVTNNLESC